MMNFRSALTLCIGSLAVAGGANASDVLVFDNGAGGAAGSNNSIVSDRSFPNFSADDFLLSSATTITRVEWTGRYGGTPNATDDFTIAFFEDDGSGGASGFGLPNSATQVSFDVGNNVNRTATESVGFLAIRLMFLSMQRQIHDTSCRFLKTPQPIRFFFVGSC